MLLQAFIVHFLKVKYIHRIDEIDLFTSLKGICNKQMDR